MINRLINNLNLKKLLIYLFVLLTILNCASIYYLSILNNLWRLILFIIFIFALPKLSTNIAKRLIIFCFFFGIYVIGFLMWNYIQSPSFNIITYTIILLIDPVMLITFFLYQAQNDRIKKVLYIFEKIVIILAIISFVFWILIFIGLKPNMSFVTHWGGISRIPGFFGLDYIAQPNTTFLGMKNVVRNCGIFAEPPMYSYVLCIALLIELFIKNSSSIFNFRVISLFIVIVSTTSTTGLLISIPAIMLKIFLLIKNKSVKTIMLLLIPVILYLLKFILNNKENATNPQVFAESSYIQRHDDIISCLHAWRYHPLIGNGIHNPDIGSNFNIAEQTPGTINLSSTSSLGGTTGLMSVLAYGGIIYALLYIIPSLLFSFKSLSNCFFAILAFILFVFTGINESFVYIMVLAYFWACTLFSGINNNQL